MYNNISTVNCSRYTVVQLWQLFQFLENKLGLIRRCRIAVVLKSNALAILKQAEQNRPLIKKTGLIIY
jgi:hypothetical protein